MTSEKEMLMRRIFHLMFSLVIVYYLLPNTIFNISKDYYLIILIFLLPIFIEIYRLNLGVKFYGLHDREKNHIASYVWFTTGATFLILFFPQQIAAPCILATALGDPVIGLTKPLRRRFIFSIAFLICLVIFILFKYDLLVAIFAAAVTFIAESFEFKIRARLRPNLFWSRSKHKFSEYKRVFDFLFRTDDDFMMQVIPAIALLILFSIFPELLPEKVLYPIPFLESFA